MKIQVKILESHQDGNFTIKLGKLSGKVSIHKNDFIERVEIVKGKKFIRVEIVPALTESEEFPFICIGPDSGGCSVNAKDLIKENNA